MIELYNIDDFVGGWFIGNFEPSLNKTKDFEVSIKTHEKGEIWDKHYHKIATEYNYVIGGQVEINGVVYKKGDIFVVPPMEIVDPNFLETCEIVCVKTPSAPNDKYVVKRDD